MSRLDRIVDALEATDGIEAWAEPSLGVVNVVTTDAPTMYDTVSDAVESEDTPGTFDAVMLTRDKYQFEFDWRD